MLSIKRASSFTDSPGSSTRSRSLRPLSACCIAMPGSRPAVVTVGPKRVFTTGISSKTAPVALAKRARAPSASVAPWPYP